MVTYNYTARNTASGEIVKAQVQAESPQAAAKLLAGQKLFALDITEEGASNPINRLGLGGHVSGKERVLFTRQLSTLINAGLPLARALRLASDQVGSKAFKKILTEVISSVEGGSTLSDAFAAHPKVFNKIYISLVAAGETSGTLDKALLRLATQQEKDAAIASKIRGAMVYPAIVLVIIIAVVGFMVTGVVPQVAKLYADLHKTLPFYTLGLVWLADFIIHFWWVVIILVIGAFFGLRTLLATPTAQRQIDKLKLQIPVFGILFKKVYMARFTRTMSSLLGSGIPMIQALETVRDSSGNSLVGEDVDRAITAVRGGKALSQGLENATTFLPLVAQMSRIGEESGAIDDLLGRTATYYEDEVDEAVKNLSTTLEPLMMVALGGIVALVLLAVMGPVYSLVGSGNLGS